MPALQEIESCNANQRQAWHPYGQNHLFQQCCLTAHTLEHHCCKLSALQAGSFVHHDSSYGALHVPDGSCHLSAIFRNKFAPTLCPRWLTHTVCRRLSRSMLMCMRSPPPPLFFSQHSRSLVQSLVGRWWAVRLSYRRLLHPYAPAGCAASSPTAPTAAGMSICYNDGPRCRLCTFAVSVS